MTIDRAIEYLEAIKEAYPDAEVEDACNMAIDALRDRLS
jgi:hypothetical protein